MLLVSLNHLSFGKKDSVSHRYHKWVVQYESGFSFLDYNYLFCGNMGVHYRFADSRHLVGFNYGQSISLNNNGVTGLKTDPITLEAVAYADNASYGFQYFLAEYAYYLTNPLKRRFNVKVGSRVGFMKTRQYLQNSSEYYELSHVTNTSAGISGNVNLSLEYSYRLFSVFAILKVHQSFINKKITTFSKRAVIGLSAQLGFSIDMQFQWLFPKK